MSPKPALRVAHLTSGDLWGGAEAAIFHLLEALHQERDVEVRAVLLNAGQLSRALSGAGIPVTVVAEAGASFFALARRVRAALEPSDLVHAHRAKENLLAALSGRPWMTTWHGGSELPPFPARLRAQGKRALDGIATLLLARRVVGVSRGLHSRARRLVGRRADHCWNGIPDPLGGRPPVPWDERPRRIGVLGRLFPVKGFDLAVEAAALCPGLEMDIVGEGPERTRLERLIRHHGATERIRVLGHQPDPLARLASWRGLLVTSHHEGNPIAVLEALAVGTPVISAALPGVEEILSGTTGLVLAERDPRLWAEAIARLLVDPVLAADWVRSGRRRFADHFTARAAAQRMLTIYRGLSPELPTSEAVPAPCQS